jgi:hypothetical protein
VPAAFGQSGSPFDPSGFIESAETNKAGDVGITTTGVYRIDGRRFFQFAAGSDEVFLPAVGDRPEIREELALCRPHLPLKREVLMIRDKLKPESWVKVREPEIFALILKCRDGAIKGPTAQLETNDGATVEVQAKKPEKKVPSHRAKD